MPCVPGAPVSVVRLPAAHSTKRAVPVQDGLFAVLALEAENDDPAAVHFAFASSSSHSSSDVATHLEVVKQASRSIPCNLGWMQLATRRA